MLHTHRHSDLDETDLTTPDRAPTPSSAAQSDTRPPMPANENNPIDPSEFWRRLGL
ncbi:MAG TPA: hypothetical protein VF463_15880 [Sphingobium sp.]